MDDDMYPNDGSTFFHVEEPENQVKSRRESQSKAQAAKPIIKDLIDIFEQDLLHLGDTDTIHVDPDTQPEDFLKAWYAVQEVKKYAREKKEFLESLLIDLK